MVIKDGALSFTWKAKLTTVAHLRGGKTTRVKIHAATSDTLLKYSTIINISKAP